MGTRHLIAVQHNNHYPIAQYGQWDGYPEGAGVHVLNFLVHEYNRKEFIRGLERCSFITRDALEALWRECGATSLDLVSLTVANKFSEKHPQLSRDCGANILRIVQNSTNPLLLKNNITFAADSLFCEWAYVIDLDKNVLEVYMGFNKLPLDSSERFANMLEESANPEYYPVKLVKSWSLDNMPTQTEFLAELLKREDGPSLPDGTDAN